MLNLQERLERVIERLKRLEIDASRLTPEGRRKSLMTVAIFNAIGFHLGDPQPHELPPVSYGRALGYKSNDPNVLFEYFRKDPAEHQRRHSEAFLKLLAKFKLKSDDEEVVHAVLPGGRIWQSLPRDYRVQLEDLSA